MMISRLPHAHADESGMCDMHCRFITAGYGLRHATKLPAGFSRRGALHILGNSGPWAVHFNAVRRAVHSGTFLSQNASSTGIGG